MFVPGGRVRIGTLRPMALVAVALTAAAPPTVFIAVTPTAFFAAFAAVEPLVALVTLVPMAPAGACTSIPMAFLAISLAVPGPSGCCRPAKFFDGRPIMAFVQSFA